MHKDLAAVHKCQEIIVEWLSDMGLELKSEKTRLAHTLNPVNGKVGFNFLGFEIRQYYVGIRHRRKSGREYKTIIKPSKELQKRHYDALAEIVKSHKTASQAKLINRLNPVIRGWCNYVSPMSSKKVMTRMGNLIYNKLRAWVRRRHPNKNAQWKADKYWQSIGNKNWVFATKDRKTILYDHDSTPIVYHVKVVGESSPDDGNAVYWATRMGRNPLMKKSVARLLKKQDGRCTHCKKPFKTGDSHGNPPSQWRPPQPSVGQPCFGSPPLSR
jgi:RNA-directed DNA polymerase